MKLHQRLQKEFLQLVKKEMAVHLGNLVQRILNTIKKNVKSHTRMLFKSL